jgi:hypothetical protein
MYKLAFLISFSITIACSVCCTSDTRTIKELLVFNNLQVSEIDLPFSSKVTCIFDSVNAKIYHGYGNDDLEDYIIFDKDQKIYYVFQCSMYDASQEVKISSLSWIIVYDLNGIELGELHTVPELAKRWSYFSIKSKTTNLTRIEKSEMNENLLKYFDDEGMIPVIWLDLDEGLDYLNLMKQYLN